MKTFLLSIPEKLRFKDAKFDAQAALCGKTWSIFNDENVLQTFIFQTDGTLFITTNGITQRTSWQYFPENKGIYISETEKSGIMFHPAFLNNIILALKQEGTESTLFMINEKMKNSFAPQSLSELNKYFSSLEKIQHPQINAPIEYLDYLEPTNSAPTIASIPHNDTTSEDEYVDIWETLTFNGKEYRKVSSVGKSFWVSKYGEYAFDALVQNFGHAILVKQAGKYRLRFDGKHFEFNSLPRVIYFKNGDIEEGTLVGNDEALLVFFYYYKTGWELCYQLENCASPLRVELINLNGDIRYICTDSGVSIQKEGLDKPTAPEKNRESGSVSGSIKNLNNLPS